MGKYLKFPTNIPGWVESLFSLFTIQVRELFIFLSNPNHSVPLGLDPSALNWLAPKEGGSCKCDTQKTWYRYHLYSINIVFPQHLKISWALCANTLISQANVQETYTTENVPASSQCVSTCVLHFAYFAFAYYFVAHSVGLLEQYNSTTITTTTN